MAALDIGTGSTEASLDESAFAPGLYVARAASADGSVLAVSRVTVAR